MSPEPAQHADYVFGPDYVHVPFWFCETHRDIARDADHECHSAPGWWPDRPPCHLFELGYRSVLIDGGERG